MLGKLEFGIKRFGIAEADSHAKRLLHVVENSMYIVEPKRTFGMSELARETTYFLIPLLALGF